MDRVMGVKIADSNKSKYAVYLRAEASNVVEALKTDSKGKPRSVSSILAGIVGEYRRIKEARPGAIEQARVYVNRKGINFADGAYTGKVQVYLDPEDGKCLEDYAGDRADGNVSIGINKLIAEYVAIAVVCPGAMS